MPSPGWLVTLGNSDSGAMNVSNSQRSSSAAYLLLPASFTGHMQIENGHQAAPRLLAYLGVESIVENQKPSFLFFVAFQYWQIDDS